MNFFYETVAGEEKTELLALIFKKTTKERRMSVASTGPKFLSFSPDDLYSMSPRRAAAMGASLDIINDRTVCEQLRELGFDINDLIDGNPEFNLTCLVSFLKCRYMGENKTSRDHGRIPDFDLGVYDIKWFKDYLWTVTCPPYNI